MTARQDPKPQQQKKEEKKEMDEEEKEVWVPALSPPATSPIQGPRHQASTMYLLIFGVARPGSQLQFPMSGILLQPCCPTAGPSERSEVLGWPEHAPLREEITQRSREARHFPSQPRHKLSHLERLRGEHPFARGQRCCVGRGAAGP